MPTKNRTSIQIFHSFLYKQMLLSNGLVNCIINSLIYLAITRNPCSNLDYIFSTLITNAILGVIVVILYPIMIKLSLKKNPSLKIPYKREEHLLASLYPKNQILIRIINFLVGFILTTLITMGIIGCCNLTEISVALGTIFRGIDCFIYSVIAYYLCVVFTDNIQTPNQA